jgi:hypothetical protein
MNFVDLIEAFDIKGMGLESLKALLRETELCKEIRISVTRLDKRITSGILEFDGIFFNLEYNKDEDTLSLLRTDPIPAKPR